MADNNATVVVAASTRTIVSQREKQGKFSGVNFKGWRQRVFFCLTTLDLQKFSNEETPVLIVDMLNREKFLIIEA